MKKSNIETLDQFIDEEIGKKGTQKREKFDAGYEIFKSGVLTQLARQQNTAVS